jgi:integrase
MLIEPSSYDLAEPLMPVAAAPLPAASAPPVASLTLAEAYRNYIDDPTRAWTANTREAYETSRRLAIAVIGEAVLPDPINKRDKRSPFDRGQLYAIFNAPLYRGCVDGGRGYNKVGDQRPRNARFWVPLIALFTGARLGEICQLDATDIRTVDGVDCIVVSLRSLNGTTDKQLKTTASDRLIPVHPTLIDCGLLRFAEAKRKAGEKKLFDDIETGSTGSRPVAFSKWFTQFLRACGAQRSRTSFHSFRHNFRDELRAARIDHDIALLLGGWTLGTVFWTIPERF